MCYSIDYNKKGAFCFILSFLFAQLIWAQNNNITNYKKYEVHHNEQAYVLFDFVVDSTISSNIRVAYFGSDAFQQYQELKEKEQVLLATSASFTSSFNHREGNPVGFCSENGTLLNKMMHHEMDGLVLISGISVPQTAINVLDLDDDLQQCAKFACARHVVHLNPRQNNGDTYYFHEFVKKENLSIFQTHLVYSKFRPSDSLFLDLDVGASDRGRRFLALCEKNGLQRHVIIDAFEHDYLMASAKHALELMIAQGYNITYLVNLDTGTKDMLRAFNGSTIENLRPDPLTEYAKIENSSSILVYYIAK